jgi:glucose/arabinose dehydrogenase
MEYALPRLPWCIAVAIAANLAACADTAKLPAGADFGTQAQIVAPHRSLVPTVHIAPAAGWPVGGKPTAAAGTAVGAFAAGLDHPRWLYVLPNGDVLVAETDAPPKPQDQRGFKGWAMKKLMGRAGSGKKSADRITLLRDTRGTGVADTRTVLLDGLHSPFGMALVGDRLYVADSDAVLSFAYVAGETHIAGEGTKVVDLPAGLINHHWTKNLIASPDGSHLYVTVGSNSNAAENGMENELGRAAVWEVDPRTGSHRLFASGLRNPNGLAWEPSTGALWVAVNERDELGSDLVPDYMTALVDGGFYGWPYSYYGAHVDARVKPEHPDLVAKAIVPDYALGAHTASLGLTFGTDDATNDLARASFGGGMFVGQHGSWNRRPRSGYQVLFIPFKNGKPAGAASVVLSGFVDDRGKALGRPVGVAFDKRGGLLVADDVGNTVWRVTAAEHHSASR